MNISPDFRPNLRIGPSVLSLYRSCKRAWALRYIAGHDSLSYDWRGAGLEAYVYDKSLRMWTPPPGQPGPVVTRKQRSTALGTEAHRIVELHYMSSASCKAHAEPPTAADWASFPGQVAQAWLDVMPPPGDCAEVYTELPVRLEPPDDIDAPPIEGTNDLLLRLWDRSRSVGSYCPEYAPGEYWLGDWKTTRDWRYKKDAETLYEDFQGIVYPLAAMRRFDLHEIKCRWAYSITDPNKRREARATDFVQTREHAEAAVRPLFETAADIRDVWGEAMSYAGAWTSAGQVPVTPEALLRAALMVEADGVENDQCDAYGGCPHRADAGGACTAPLQRSLGARIQGRAAANTCAPATPVVPLESLLRKSVEANAAKAAGGVTPMSPFKQKLEQLKLSGGVPLPPPTPGQAPTGYQLPMAAVAVAEAAASVRLDGETVALDPQPEAPAPALDLEPVVSPAEVVADMAGQMDAAIAEAAPKRRGRPPGAKNRPAPAEVAVAINTDQVQAIAAGEVPDGVTPEQAEAMRPLATALASSPDVAEELLPPINDNVTLKTLARVAANLGVRIVVRFGA